MGKNDTHLVRYAIGKSTNLAKAWNRTSPWVKFCTELSTPVKTGESRAKFDEMSKDEQDLLKAINGWISTAQCKDNKRNLKNVLPRNLLSLDLDYCEIETMEAIAAGTGPLARFESFTHSSRRHTKRKPRLRQFYPLKRDVDADEYHALVRIISYILDGKREPIIQVDRVSARPAQMMFKPTTSKDGDWFCHRQEGRLLDPDEIFDLWKKKKGDPKDISTLPLFDTETDIRKRAAKSENPLEKPGIIGAFCRAYTIEDAMEKFIPGTYIPGDTHSENPRYTYAGSTSSNGAIVYDGGLFLYSNHGHDPCCEQNINAFDMVRLHKFGELDEGFDLKNTKITALPSFKAMSDFARADSNTKHELSINQRALIEQFDDETTDAPEEPNEDDLIGDDPLPKALEKKKEKKKKRDTSWLDELERDKQGRYISSLANVTKIIMNDPRLGVNIGYNEFLSRIALVGDLKTRINGISTVLCKNTKVGMRWSDRFNHILRLVLEEPMPDQGGCGWGLRVSDRDLDAAKQIAAHERAFHPVKTYFESLRWDGKPRIETCFSRYLGCRDSAYTRQVSQNVFLACVARIYQPGHKFDFVVIIQGKQGCRKSTFVLNLAPAPWTGVFNTKFDDPWRVADQTMGKLILEMGEIHNFKKADFGLAKEFVRRQRDDVRLPWGKEITELPRQFILIGTTNDDKFLRDPSGNRAYWPIITPKTIRNPVNTDALRLEIDQLWAEALALYQKRMNELPAGAEELDLSLQGEEAMQEAEALQEQHRSEELSEGYANAILAFLDTPLTLAEARRLFGVGGAESRFPADGELDPDTTKVRLCAISTREMCMIVFNGNPLPRNPAEKATLEQAQGFLLGWHRETTTVGRKANTWKWGRSTKWLIRTDATPAEQKLGYALILDDLIG